MWHCMLLWYPSCFKYLFKNKTRRKKHQINLCPGEFRNLYSFSLLGMHYSDWTVKMLLANSRVPERQSNMPRISLFFFSFSPYYETVIAIAQLRLNLASITMECNVHSVYSSHQVLVPQAIHSLWNSMSHLTQSWMFQWKLRKK